MFYKKILTIFMLGILQVAAAWGQFDHTHSSWTTLLKKHVIVIDNGKTSQRRYAEIAKDRAALKSYLDALAKVSETDFRGWNKNQRLVFLLNAHNASMVERIVHSGKAPIRHLDYDWALNDVKK
jgi:hypothetical protein